MYVAIIGDLVSSRLIKDRRGAQEELKGILKHVNEEFKDEIASAFVLTLGDEFQGLLKSPQKLFPILWTIAWHNLDLHVRFGVGLGAITTEIDPTMSIGADGPAYYAARAMIEEIRERETGKHIVASNLRLAFAEQPEATQLINVTLQFMSFLEKNWTLKQKENVRDSLLLDLNQSELSLRRNVNQSTIQRSLASAGFVEYCQGAQAIKEQLLTLWGKL